MAASGAFGGLERHVRAAESQLEGFQEAGAALGRGRTEVSREGSEYLIW